MMTNDQLAQAVMRLEAQVTDLDSILTNHGTTSRILSRNQQEQAARIDNLVDVTDNLSDNLQATMAMVQTMREKLDSQYVALNRRLDEQLKLEIQQNKTLGTLTARLNQLEHQVTKELATAKALNETNRNVTLIQNHLDVVNSRMERQEANLEATTATMRETSATMAQEIAKLAAQMVNVMTRLDRVEKMESMTGQMVKELDSRLEEYRLDVDEMMMTKAMEKTPKTFAPLPERTANERMMEKLIENMMTIAIQPLTMSNPVRREMINLLTQLKALI